MMKVPIEGMDNGNVIIQGLSEHFLALGLFHVQQLTPNCLHSLHPPLNFALHISSLISVSVINLKTMINDRKHLFNAGLLLLLLVIRPFRSNVDALTIDVLS